MKQFFSANTGNQYQDGWRWKKAWNKPNKKTATRKDDLDVFSGIHACRLKK